MNKKILTIAITCFSCLLLITSFTVADKPEWAGKPEWAEKDKELRKAQQEAEREAKKAEKKKDKGSSDDE